MPYAVLLVDDHKIMRDGIKAILSRGNEFRVIGEAENGPEAVQFCRDSIAREISYAAETARVGIAQLAAIVQ